MSDTNETEMTKTSSSENLSTQIESQLSIKGKRSRSGSFGSEDALPSKKMSRSHSPSQDDLPSVISQTQKMYRLPQPPAGGRLGRPTKVRVNCFPVQCRTKQISLYSMHFEPEIPEDSYVLKMEKIYELDRELRKTFIFFIVDKNRLWSMKNVEGPILLTGPTCSVRIEHVRSVDLNKAPYDQFNQVIHILFARAARSMCLMRIGRNYYDKNTFNDEKYLLHRDRVRLFRGYSMTISQAREGLILTVDASHRVISTDNISQWKQNNYRRITGLTPTPVTTPTRRGANDRSHLRGIPRVEKTYSTGSTSDYPILKNTPEFKKAVEDRVIGTVVLTTHNYITYRICGVNWDMDIFSKFEAVDKAGKPYEVTFQDYFRKKYVLDLVDYNQGLLEVQRKKMKGSIFLPPELCFFTGITEEDKMNFDKMKRIRAVTSIKPHERAQSTFDLGKLMSQAVYSSPATSSEEEQKEGDEEKKEEKKKEADLLKIDVDPNPIVNEARILDDVNVRIKSDQTVKNVKCKDLMRSWARALYINQNPHKVRNWIVFYERGYENAMDMMINELMRNAAQYRMLSQPLDAIMVRCNARNASDVHNSWRDTIEEMINVKVKNLDLIVALIPSHPNSDHVYSAVKSVTLMHPEKLISTQCIKAQRFDRRGQGKLRSVISGTLKQILTKRGNIPWIVDYKIRGDRFNPFKQNTMVIGIDVNHDRKRNRSTAGICVSGDSKFCRYDTYVSIGPAGCENISGAEKSMVKSLMNFNKDNGKLPEHIIVYRDGVSNSELLKVLETEVKAFRDGFKHKNIKKITGEKPYEPKLTFVVVQKRVSLRIFDQRLESGTPGTVLDTGIVSSRFWDFYMLTTNPPRGKTARPTRYIVVYDDFGMTNDELQSFTFQLCHTYYNFPGPIRVPASVQIAHQVAYLYGSIIPDTPQTALFTPKCKGKAYYM